MTRDQEPTTCVEAETPYQKIFGGSKPKQKEGKSMADEKISPTTGRSTLPENKPEEVDFETGLPKKVPRTMAELRDLEAAPAPSAADTAVLSLDNGRLKVNASLTSREAIDWVIGLLTKTRDDLFDAPVADLEGGPSTEDVICVVAAEPPANEDPPEAA